MSIYNDYHSLGKHEKKAFQNEILEKLDIKIYTFWNWIMRDTVPKKYQERYDKILKDSNFHKK